MSVASSFNSPKRLERFLDLSQLRLCRQSAGECLLRSLAEQIGRNASAGAVIERLASRSHRYRANPGARLEGHIGVMQYDTFRNAKAPLSPCQRQREMDLRRQHI